MIRCCLIALFCCFSVGAAAQEFGGFVVPFSGCIGPQSFALDSVQLVKELFVRFE